jgi:D-serine deaminase-like pyridoxal phosphate-dependent protein
MTAVTELDTPAVTIRLDRLERNIDRMQSRLDAAGKGNRPHIKTHKIPAIAKMQMDAGAIGITCQKVSEAEVFADAGVADDILITFNILGEKKTDHLMQVAEKVKRLAVVADNEVVVRGLSEAGIRHGRDVPILIECDLGFGRNGVQSPEDALSLARLAMNLRHIRFEGLMGFPTRGEKAKAFLSRAVDLFAAEGIPLPVISGGGSPAAADVGDFPMTTEHRAGTYVYNDLMMIGAGAATLDDCAMYVRTTVVSRPNEDRAIVDAGSKVLTRERHGLKTFGHVVEYPDAFVSNLSEEHGMIDLSRSAAKPKIGEVINIVPNHCCVVSNMVDEVHGIRDGQVEITWPVAARGRVT